MVQPLHAPPEGEITDEQKDAAEDEIREKQNPVDYDTKEYPVEILVQKYMDGRDDDTNELFIPDYQREFVWDEESQSKFIESVILGLPIPYIFVADVPGGKNEARLEIIDGSQRIRTLARFLNNEFRLGKLEKLKELNGFKFSDLLLSRQRRFKRTTLRMIQVTEKADEGIRRDIFERINTGSVALNEMEVRRGSRGVKQGSLLHFIDQLSENVKFRELCPFSEALVRRQEHREFVLRFFAYLNNRESSEQQVSKFIDEYLDRNSDVSEFDRKVMQNEFESMLDFVERYFLHGFHREKDPKNTPPPRIRFEAISVGVALALREKRDLKPKSTKWIYEEDWFRVRTNSDAIESKDEVVAIIKTLCDRLLGRL